MEEMNYLLCYVMEELGSTVKLPRSSATTESTARPILVPIESSYATSY